MWNTHQRLTLIHADNDNDKRYWMPTYQSYTKTTEETDTYPYWSMVNDEWSMVNDSLTNNSIPVASVYHGNTDNSLFMNRGIQKITQLDNGSISFRFDELSVKYVAVDTTMTDKPDLTGAIFYESFDRCIGTGGNDGVFKGSSDVASADFLPDNGGWDSMVMKGGARCAKFGNATYDGIVSSPFILLTGDSLLLSFKAAPWSRDDTSLSISATGDAKFETSEFEMTEGQWTTFSTVLTGQGNIQITFTPGRRFFLDEVVVKKLPENYAEGISHQEVAFKPNVSYDLSGRQIEDGKLKRGVYLIRKSDGSFRKVITRE